MYFLISEVHRKSEIHILYIDIDGTLLLHHNDIGVEFSFMGNVVSDHNEVSVKPLFRFLQPNHFHHPCILSSNVGFSVCSRLDLPLLPSGFQSFPSADADVVDHTWSGSELVGALWISEISGPFEDLRVILKELGYRDTNLNLAVDICFAVIFSFARMIGGTYLTYLTVSADNPILIKAMGVGLQSVSTFWFYRIVRIWRFKLSKITKSKS
nr:transmembrane protein 136-like isoform X1 [Ipomoea trifida]